MDNLVWNVRQRQGYNSKDVTVTISKSKSHKNPYTVFTFRDNCHLKFTQNERAVFAVAGNRIYFKQEKEGIAYKLSERSKSFNTYELKATIDLQDFIGDYDLQYDKELKLSYIEKQNEKEW